jgi:hypothetical protein
MPTEIRSPDGHIVIEDTDRVRLRFEPGAFAMYEERELAGQLAQAVTLAWTGSDDGAEFEDWIRSPNGWVEIGTAALTHWQVHVRPGACERIGAAEFAEEVRQVLQVIVDRYADARGLQ